MIRTKWLVAAFAAACVAGAAGTAQAQDYMDSGRGRGAARHGTRVSVGSQVFHDTRGVIASDYEEDVVGGGSTLDETAIEHDVENTMTHDGAFITIEAVIDGQIQFRVGGKLGFFQATVRNEFDPPVGGRANFTSASEVGLGGGILASMRTDLSPMMWFDATLDATFGQAAIDNETPLLNLAEGTYMVILAEVTPRIGFRFGPTPISGFLGLGLSFYQGTYDLDTVYPGTSPGSTTGEKATVGNWSFIRIVFGFQFDEGPTHGRLQFSIWNPSRDLGAAVNFAVDL